MNISEAAKHEADFDDVIQEIKWEEIFFQDKNTLNDNEYVRPDIVGLAVDYLSRMMITGDKNKAFRISLMFKRLTKYPPESWECHEADRLFEHITGLDDSSIINACQLVCFDTLYRRSDKYSAFLSDYNRYSKLPYEYYISTVENIRIMVQRCIEYFKGWNSLDIGFGVHYAWLHGDGDYCADTELCDLKVSKYKLHEGPYPQENFLHHTKQVLLYWYAGLHTEGLDFSIIDTLSIFNPRLNIAWKTKVSQLPEDLPVDLDMFCWECV